MAVNIILAHAAAALTAARAYILFGVDRVDRLDPMAQVVMV